MRVIATVLLAACGGAPATEAPAPTEEPATEAPAPTEAPATEAPATEAPTEAPAAYECTDALGCVTIAPGDPIHFAWINSVFGPTAALGQTNVNGGQLAIDDRGGELLGHPIQYDGEDSLCNAEGGQAAGTKIAADPTVVAVQGTTCSSEARAASPLISAAGMVMMSASNTNPDLTNPDHPDFHPGYFRTAHNDLFTRPHYGGFVESLLLTEMPAEVRFQQLWGVSLDAARNYLIDCSKQAGTDYLLWVDNDASFPPGAINRMIAHNLDGVRVHVYHQPTTKAYHGAIPWPGCGWQALVQVRGCGAHAIGARTR